MVFINKTKLSTISTHTNPG